MRHFASLLALATGTLVAATCHAKPALTVDFSHTDGVIRPLHGVNGGPLNYRGVVDLSDHYKALNIPLARLHDIPWAYSDVVDISMVFPDFRDDPGDPASYRFAATDDFIDSLVTLGIPILYRLGESIEHTVRKYRVNPPEDFAKWAEICCGVIRHYNEGWAGGFHHNIRYWEVLNEPDLAVNRDTWAGTDAQSLELYTTTAKAIKQRWPNLKVGGPGLRSAGKIVDGRFQPSKYLLLFLRHCRDNQVPLDFLSWHRYTNDPAEYPIFSREVRRLLDEHGFTAAESHLNEWNYLPRNDWTSLRKGGQGVPRQQWLTEMGSSRGAAFVAWTLISLQREPLDMANFFTADTQMLGTFTPDGVPKKNFYAFKAFSALLQTPVRMATPSPQRGEIAVCAGINDAKTTASILLSNFNAGESAAELTLRGLPWPAPTRFELVIVDDDHDFKPVRSGRVNANGRIPLPELKPYTVALLRLSPTTAAP